MNSNDPFPLKKMEIIKIALDLFIEHGYEQTKISTIMQATQLSKGGMYHYFESKEAILDAVIEYAFTEKLEHFEMQLQAAPDTFTKMAVFLDNEILTQTEFSTKFLTLATRQKNTLVQYRINEFNTIFAVPYLRSIIDFGLQAGVFQTDFPEEITPVLFCAGDLFFRELSLLKQAPTYEKEVLINKKIDAFTNLIQKTLDVSLQDTLIFREIITKESLKIQR